MHVIIARYGADALERLREVVAEAKRDDPMSPVTVLVPNNIAGMVARRHLAHGLVDGRPGVAGVRILTSPRLAEELAAVHLAPRRPATRAILAAAWRGALADAPGVFAEVAAHTATIEALVRAHRELRDLDRAALEAVELGGAVQRDLVRLHRSVVARLEPDWYDETDLLRVAAALPDLGHRVRGAIVLHLPQVLSRTERALVGAIDAALGVTVVLGLTGVLRADGEVLESLGVDPARMRDVRPPVAHAVLSSSDSDDEVRGVARAVLADLEATPAHRIAVLYSDAEPYAQTLHERFAAMGIAVNGPGVRTVADRAAARLLLEVLALADRDLPRGDLFRALSAVPAADFGGERIPLATWERVSREAGVVGGDDWDTRLLRFVDESRAEIVRATEGADPQPWRLDRLEERIAAASALRAFTLELRERLAAAQAMTSWSALSAFALDLLHVLLPSATIGRMPPEEQAAEAAIIGVLRGLPTLDGLDRAASLETAVEVLRLELDAVPPRVGTFGNGVLVAPVSAAIGLDLDRVHVLGLAEDLYPGRVAEDALLPQSVRSDPAAQLPALRRRLDDRHRALLAAMQIAPHVTVSVPRGDLRRSTIRLPSRWLLPTFRSLASRRDFSMTEWEHQDYGGALRVSGSFAGELLSATLPADRQEWRTRAVAAGLPIADAAHAAATEMLRARAGARFTRFDGNLADVEGLPDLFASDVAIAPTVLEGYAVCPHAYFMQRLLRVQPIEQPEDIVSIRAVDIGTLVHRSMDALTAATDPPGYGEPWSAEQRALLQRMAREQATLLEQRGLTGHPRLWAVRREELFGELALMLDDDDRVRAERGSRVLTSELEFGMNGAPPVEIPVEGGRILMKGSADRVDRTADGRLYVLDLKSGSDRSYIDIAKGDHLANGTKLQLPVYAYAARVAFGASDVSAEYWFVLRGMTRIEVPLAAVEHDYARTIALLAASIRTGVFPERPPDKPDFAWVQCRYCNPDGIGHGESRERWERKRSDMPLSAYVGLVEPGTVQP